MRDRPPPNIAVKKPHRDCPVHTGDCPQARDNPVSQGQRQPHYCDRNTAENIPSESFEIVLHVRASSITSSDANESSKVAHIFDRGRADSMVPLSVTVSSLETLARVAVNITFFGWQGYPSPLAPVRKSAVMENDLGERSGGVKREHRKAQNALIQERRLPCPSYVSI